MFDSILSKRVLMVCVRVCLRVLLCFVLYTNQPWWGRLQPGRTEACRMRLSRKKYKYILFFVLYRISIRPKEIVAIVGLKFLDSRLDPDRTSPDVPVMM